MNMDDSVYIPSEDTFALLDTLIADINTDTKYIILEIGTGSGYIIKYLMKHLNTCSFIATDINPHALNHANTYICSCESARSNFNMTNKIRNPLEKNLQRNHTRFCDAYRLNSIKNNLLQGIKQDNIDIVIFNPPYVATDEVIDVCSLCYAGGKQGREVIDKFIDMLKIRIVYLLVISINNVHDVCNKLSGRNYNVEVLKRRKILGESIYILKGTLKK